MNKYQILKDIKNIIDADYTDRDKFRIIRNLFIRKYLSFLPSDLLIILFPIFPKDPRPSDVEMFKYYLDTHLSKMGFTYIPTIPYDDSKKHVWKYKLKRNNLTSTTIEFNFIVNSFYGMYEFNLFSNDDSFTKTMRYSQELVLQRDRKGDFLFISYILKEVDYLTKQVSSSVTLPK